MLPVMLVAAIGMNMVGKETMLINAEAGKKRVSVLDSITDVRLGCVLSYSGE